MYKYLGFHFAAWLWLLWPLRFLIKIEVRPEGLTREKFLELINNRDLIYVFQRMSFVDVYVLNRVLNQLRMPRVRSEAHARRKRVASLLAIRHRPGFVSVDRRDSFSEHLASILKADSRVAKDGLALFPVTIFWKRNAGRPDRNPVLRILFPEDAVATSVQKILSVLFAKRVVHLHFGQPISLQEGLTSAVDQESVPNEFQMQPPSSEQKPLPSPEESTNEFQIARRFRRKLLIQFIRERTAALGPMLYEFNGMANWILGSKETKKILEVQGGNAELRKNQIKIFKYLKEIAANYSFTAIRAYELVFDFLWTRIFKGVRVRNIDAVSHVAKGGQIIWMPSHRSHLDYLLLSYVLFKKNLVPPHIAAGVNLSFWPAGPILRRGGAFFLRRSFAGNKLYAHTFANYVHFLLHNSFPLEFFHEGGRSRIGKLLAPKFGMLSMCTTSVLKRRAENTYIVPVYIGYDKVVEGDAYAKELGGAKKEKENLFQLLGAVKHLFGNYGRVDVSFGAPIRFGDAWEQFFGNQFAAGRPEDAKGLAPLSSSIADLPDDVDARDPRVQNFVRHLSIRVNQNINSTATASGSALLTSVLLANNDSSMTEFMIRERISILHNMILRLSTLLGWTVSPSSTSDNPQSNEDSGFLLTQFHEEEGKIQEKDVTTPVTQETKSESNVIPQPLQSGLTFDKIIDEILKDGQSWQFLTPDKSSQESAFVRNKEKEMNLWWYRGTIFHLLAVPGLVSSLLADMNPEDSTVAKLDSRLSAIREVWAEELYWPDTASTSTIVLAGLAILQDLGCVDAAKLERGEILLSTHPIALERMKFFADLVRPERELYSIQLFAGIELVERKGSFSRDELIRRATEIHRAAFLRGVASTPANLSQVFGNRTFEALYRTGLFVPKSGLRLCVSFTELVSVSHFFDVASWREFSP
jgi:glycerol-3-phosphate O-acyltransferase